MNSKMLPDAAHHPYTLLYWKRLFVIGYFWSAKSIQADDIVRLCAFHRLEKEKSEYLKTLEYTNGFDHLI